MTSVLLAAHGSSLTNTAIVDLARSLAELTGFAVSAGFHVGEPSFEDAASALVGEPLVILPLMMARGYFSRQVLPRSLRDSAASRSRQIIYADPLGLHPELAARLAARVATALEDLELARPFIALVGHGTSRDSESRDSAVATARCIARILDRPCQAYFLDDSPLVEQAVVDAADRDLLVLPFLVGGGQHSGIDLERIGVPQSGRRAVLPPIIEDPLLPQMLSDLIGAVATQRVVATQGIVATPRRLPRR